MDRRTLLQAAGALGLLPSAVPSTAEPLQRGDERVLRYALRTAETGFDPAQISDLYSMIVCDHLFEGLYEYDHLARPFKIKPCTAQALPEISDDFRSWTIRIKPGIHFQDDPAFGGSARELVAADYAYTLRRFYDPALKSPAQSALEEQGIVGLRELRDESLASRRPFDYDKPVAGLETPDRYTLRIRLREPRPRLLYTLTSLGAMAREVVERYGDQIMAHPVGTGPFRLQAWRRSSLITLVRNPGYRERFFDAEPAADDAEGQALLARFKGRRLPMLDRVELSVIEEAQPRWLSFLNKEHDFLFQLPLEFVRLAIPGGKLAPHLAKQHLRAYREAASDITLTVFNMDDPVVGGLQPAQVALRRAIGLGLNIRREITLARRGEAIPAQGAVVPGTYGYDPALRSEAGLYDPARARALLDTYGYTDRNGDGWRERPDGSPLVLRMLSQSDQTSRQLDELFKKDLDALGLRLELVVGQWAENLKATRNGRFMMWRVGSTANSPDGQDALERGFGGSVGKANLARFQLPAFDAVYRQMTALPDGPQRLALFGQANKLLLAYEPYRVHVHRMVTDIAQPWVIGYRKPLFWNGWWQFVDVLPRG
ncbi:MAG: ABC transporter substrate-binding protein [Burkholderiales bacterium]